MAWGECSWVKRFLGEEVFMREGTMFQVKLWDIDKKKYNTIHGWYITVPDLTPLKVLFQSIFNHFPQSLLKKEIPRKYASAGSRV